LFEQTTFANKITHWMSTPPLIVNGPKLQIRPVTEYDMSCPKCSKDIRVTDVQAGAVIKCPHSRCGNFTWRPEYIPPWWAKARNFGLALIGSFAVGVISSLFASKIYEEHSKVGDIPTKADAAPTIPQP